MTGLIYTYALIKSLYDQGENYIDSFWPFAMRVLNEKRFAGRRLIKKNLERTFDLKIPLHVLDTILNRAKKLGYIEQDNRNREYRLTIRGYRYLEELETEKHVRRRINSLLEDIKHYFDKYDISLNLDQIRDLLFAFLQRNIDPLIEFINPSAASDILSASKSESPEDLLIEYFQVAELQKPEHYKTLQEMVLGSIISIILYVEEPSEFIGTEKRTFKDFQLFLDTNFVFSLLGLHSSESNESARELIDMLKSYGFSFKVFSFTVEEICRVIEGYIAESYRYPTTIHVSDIYSELKKKGWTRTDAREFITNINDILRNEQIKIEWTNVNLWDYDPRNRRIVSLMELYKKQDSFSRNHDIAAIEKIRELRGKQARKIEDSKVLFLTSDIRLSRMNFREMGHKESGTVCEVILDRLLANILWLRNPKVTPPLKTIIAAYSSHLFIKREVWNKFYDIISQLRREGRICDNDILILFYRNYIEDVLEEFDETQTDQITTEFVLEEIEKAARLSEEEVDRILEEKNKEILKWIETMDRIDRKFDEIAINSARKYVRFLRILTLTPIIIPLIHFAVEKRWDRFSILCGLFALIIAMIGAGVGSFEKVWTEIEERISNRIYNKKKKEIDLDKFKTQ